MSQSIVYGHNMASIKNSDGNSCLTISVDPRGGENVDVTDSGSEREGMGRNERTEDQDKEVLDDVPSIAEQEKLNIPLSNSATHDEDTDEMVGVGEAREAPEMSDRSEMSEFSLKCDRDPDHESTPDCAVPITSGDNAMLLKPELHQKQFEVKPDAAPADATPVVTKASTPPTPVKAITQVHEVHRVANPRVDLRIHSDCLQEVDNNSSVDSDVPAMDVMSSCTEDMKDEVTTRPTGVGVLSAQNNNMPNMDIDDQHQVDENSLQVLLDELRDMLRDQQRLLPVITMSIVNAQRDSATALTALLKVDPLLEPLQRTQSLIQRIRKLDEKVLLIKATEKVSRTLDCKDEMMMNTSPSSIHSEPSSQQVPIGADVGTGAGAGARAGDATDETVDA
jgi:hypothetical protein